MDTLNQLTQEQELTILRKMVREGLIRHATPLDQIGGAINKLADAIGEEPNNVAAVMLPIFRDVVMDALTWDSVQKSMKEHAGNQGH